MGQQNFAATANYFAARARRAPPGGRRQRYQETAQLYREKAEQLGQAGNEAARETAKAPRAKEGTLSRRLRLMELFRAHAER